MTELSTEEKRAALAKVEFFAHCSAVDPHARERLGPRATRANDDG
jgi:hypothetical protein